MFAEEWPLMMFSLISQLAIGTFIMLVFARQLLRREDQKLAADVTNFGFLAVGGIMVVALICSIFHLGTPLGAYRAILNLRTSWLSREIVTASAFLFLWLASYLSYKTGKDRNMLAVVTMVMGLLLVFTMASIYSHSVRPAWTNINTFIAFYGTTFSLGSLGAISFISYQAVKADLSAQVVAVLRKISLVTIVAVLVPLVYFPFYVTSLAAASQVGALSAQILLGDYRILIGVRVVTLLVAVILAVCSLRKQTNKISINWIYLAFSLAVVGEFLGRYAFYGSGVSIMIGLK